RKPRRRKRIVIALAALLVLLLAAFAGLGWYYSSQLLVPEHSEISYTATLVATGPDTVTLTGHDTDRPGVQGLIWRGGEARLGPVLHTDGDRVQRALLSGTPPAPGTKVHIDQGLTRTDPKTALGLDFEQVGIATPLGPAPAWLVP